MKDQYVPLCYTRIWCRRNQAWLSFKTKTEDRFLVSPDGYFIELPDGSLGRISPRTTFPVVDRLPSIPLAELSPRAQFDADTLFISLPTTRSTERKAPVKVSTEEICEDPLLYFNQGRRLDDLERCILLRVLENALVSKNEVHRVLQTRQDSKSSLGELLVHGNLCRWESLLGECLDIRPVSKLDPPQLRQTIEQREWELVGEILITLGKITRTQLEHALQLKRQGSQALGQVLEAMGACGNKDVDHFLKVQEQVKDADANGVVLIGKLLVSTGVISDTDLEEVLWKQRVSRQPLGKILVSMGACSKQVIDQYEADHAGEFQQAIDEAAMGRYLVKNAKVTRAQLTEALSIQQRGRQVLGEMLLSMGLLTKDELDEAVQLQKDVAIAHNSGLQKLGELLSEQGSLKRDAIEKALKIQNVGRQQFGSILVALQACTASDINLALKVQRDWRARRTKPSEALGKAIAETGGVLPNPTMEESLLHRMLSGQAKVKGLTLKPEDILKELIDRDTLRQQDFIVYARNHLQAPSTLVDLVPVSAVDPGECMSLVNKFSDIFGKPKQKNRR